MATPNIVKLLHHGADVKKRNVPEDHNCLHLKFIPTSRHLSTKLNLSLFISNVKTVLFHARNRRQHFERPRSEHLPSGYGNEYLLRMTLEAGANAKDDDNNLPLQ